MIEIANIYSTSENVIVLSGGIHFHFMDQTTLTSCHEFIKWNIVTN